MQLKPLTDTPTLLFDYATVVEENTQEGQGLVLLCKITSTRTCCPYCSKCSRDRSSSTYFTKCTREGTCCPTITND